MKGSRKGLHLAHSSKEPSNPAKTIPAYYLQEIGTWVARAVGQADRLTPLQLRRTGAFATSAVVALLGGAAAVLPHEGAPPQDHRSVLHATCKYPSYNLSALLALPHPKHITARDSDGVDALIGRANPGLLGSEVPGAQDVIETMEAVISANAADNVQVGHRYSVPLVPAPACAGK